MQRHLLTDTLKCMLIALSSHGSRGGQGRRIAPLYPHLLTTLDTCSTQWHMGHPHRHRICNAAFHQRPSLRICRRPCRDAKFTRGTIVGRPCAQQCQEAVRRSACTSWLHCSALSTSPNLYSSTRRVSCTTPSQGLWGADGDSHVLQVYQGSVLC